MLNIIAISDIHIDNQTQGKVDGGIPIRVLDTYKSLEQVVEYSKGKAITHCLLTGDYYAHTRPSATYKEYLYKFIKNMTNMGIHCVLIEGNHDKSISSISRSSVAEFKTLDVENVTLVDKAQVLKFKDFDLAAIPWQYSPELPEFTLDKSKTQICIAHCTTWPDENHKEWESSMLGRDFEIPLDYFMQFDYTILGHIHKHQVLNETPLVMYPGSCERWTFGEWGDMGFVHIDDNGWKHIKYNLRPKYDLFNEMPKEIDPEGMYRLTVTDSFGYTSSELQWIFKDAFYFQLKEIRNFKDREMRIEEPIQDLSPTEQLNLYFKSIDQPFTEELKTLWTELTE